RGMRRVGGCGHRRSIHTMSGQLRFVDVDYRIKCIENQSGVIHGCHSLEYPIRRRYRLIKVENLTKRYAAKTAIEGMSFEVQKGEILGFLGPNGAGKTTTMRIITGFMPASDGTVRVDGFDVFDTPLDVRRRIGYLPENPPLYPEMNVAGYLRFVAKIKGVPKERLNSEVNRVMDRVNITDVKERIIAKLSKGYKQRVGLAQALINDPPVLILDEPTIG